MPIAPPKMSYTSLNSNINIDNGANKPKEVGEHSLMRTLSREIEDLDTNESEYDDEDLKSDKDFA